jgi:DNA-binding response OmpR family regulator
LSRGQRILVVEHEDNLRDLFRTALSDAGYEATVAYDGATGLELAAKVRPQLILFDIDVAKMDARTFADLYRSGPEPHAPIIAISTEPTIERVARDMGAASYLQKPFCMEQLFALVAHYALAPIGHAA